MNAALYKATYLASDGAEVHLLAPYGLIPPPFLDVHRPQVGTVRYVYQEADDAVDERPAIVAWLRTQAREGAELLAGLGDVVSPTTLALSAKAAAYSTAADLIEEGAHRAT